MRGLSAPATGYCGRSTSLISTHFKRHHVLVDKAAKADPAIERPRHHIIQSLVHGRPILGIPQKGKSSFLADSRMIS
ncbi:hypothetical protein MRBLMR1_002007 [Neorhizobium sp. LMR1-1-1.1]